MADARVSQYQVIGVTEGGYPRVSQLQVYAAAIWPSEYVRASQAQIMAVTDAAMDARVSQMQILVAARGRVNDPNIRAWTFTLDGHDFYILRLGAEETLVFDLHTESWYAWGSGEGRLWRAYTGTNWLGAGPLQALGSNVVVGDDGNGALYILDPDGTTDDDALAGGDLPRPFRRMATGQIATRGYASVPCWGVELIGSIGEGLDPQTGVTLAISDDGGRSYVDCGTVDITPGDFTARLNWLSLGSFPGPGRLFRVTDFGALQRIDNLEMVDG